MNTAASSGASSGSAPKSGVQSDEPQEADAPSPPDENGSYTSKEVPNTPITASDSSNGAIDSDGLSDEAQEADVPSPPDGSSSYTSKEDPNTSTTSGSAPESGVQSDEPPEADAPSLPDENGSYTSKEDVALFIHSYGGLPSNFITKQEAQNFGWTGGSLEPYAPGKCIGGNVFGNYEGLLPSAKGRTYQECDIDTLGASSRGAKRIVYSNDGLIYYTDDHYESFTLLYGDEKS